MALEGAREALPMTWGSLGQSEGAICGMTTSRQLWIRHSLWQLWSPFWQAWDSFRILVGSFKLRELRLSLWEEGSGWVEGSLQSPQVQLTCPTIGAIQRWGRNGSPHGKHRRLLYRRHLWKHCHQKLSPEPEKLFHHVIWAILDHYLSKNLVVHH